MYNGSYSLDQYDLLPQDVFPNPRIANEVS